MRRLKYVKSRTKYIDFGFFLKDLKPFLIVHLLAVLMVLFYGHNHDCLLTRYWDLVPAQSQLPNLPRDHNQRIFRETRHIHSRRYYQALLSMHLYFREGQK